MWIVINKISFSKFESLFGIADCKICKLLAELLPQPQPQTMNLIFASAMEISESIYKQVTFKKCFKLPGVITKKFYGQCR